VLTDYDGGGDHGRPHGVQVGGHEGDVTAHTAHQRPLASQRRDDLTYNTVNIMALVFT